MIDNIDEYSKLAIAYALEEIKCLKILKDRGYTLGKYKILPLDESSSNCCVFGNYIVDMFVDANEMKTNFAGSDKYPEATEVVDSDFFDEDDLFFEVYLIDESIIKVRGLIKEGLIDKDRFVKLSDNILIVNYDVAESQSYYDWKLPDDINDGVLFFMTDSMMVNLDFVRGYFKLKDYCEEVLKGG